MIASYLAVLGQRFFKAVLVSRKKKRINFEINGIKKQRIIMNIFSLDPGKFVSPLIRPVCGCLRVLLEHQHGVLFLTCISVP